MRANRILETCLYVEDLDVAQAFYSEILGLTAFAAVEGRHVFFRCGESVLLLFNPSETAKASRDVPVHGAHGAGHIAFAMDADQEEAWMAQLARHGIEIEAEISWPGGGRSLYFRDPSGNSLELTTPQTWGLVSPTPSSEARE